MSDDLPTEGLDDLPPERLPGPQVPSQFLDLPKPGKRGDPQVAVPFDPMGYQVLQSLAEVERKPTAGEGILTKAQIDAARRKATFVPKFSTLEGMYAQHPELLKYGRLRIERVQPQWVDEMYGGKTRVSGTLAFKHPCIGSEEFANTFGGFRYRVFGAVDQENQDNAGGPPQSVEIAVAEFEIPLAPNLSNLPVAASAQQNEVPLPFGYVGDPMFSQSPYGRHNVQPMMGYAQAPYAPAPQQNLDPILNFASNWMQRQQPSTPPVSDAVWGVLGRQSEAAQQNMRELSEQNMRILQEQNMRLQQQIEQERQRQLELANRPTDMVQMVDAVSKLTAAQKGPMDSDALRQLRDDHERQLRFIKEENERMLLRQKEEFERALKLQRDDMERLANREQTTNDIKIRIEQERVREIEKRSEQRERQLIDDAERRERSLRDEHSRIIEARDREHSMTLAQLKDMHARELQSITAMHDREMRLRDTVQVNTSQVTDKAHGIEMRALQTDLAKISAELEEKRRLVDEHMAEKNKPLLEQVREVQQLSAAVQEMAGGSDGDEKDGEEKWYNQPVFRDVLKLAVGKGLAVLPELAKLAKKGEAGAAGAGPAPQMGAIPNQPRLPPPASRRLQPLPQRKRRRVMFADSEAAPFEQFENLPAPGPTVGDTGMRQAGPRPVYFETPQADMGGPEAAMPPEPVQQPAPPPAPPAPRGRGKRQPAAAAAQPAPEPAAAEPDAPSAGGSDPWAPFAWMPVPPEEIPKFLGQLSQAHQGQLPPSALVDLMCQQVPMEVVEQIQARIPVEQLIESIRIAPATKSWKLASGGGRRYIVDVWKGLAKRVEAWKTEQGEDKSDSADAQGDDEQ